VRRPPYGDTAAPDEAGRGRRHGRATSGRGSSVSPSNRSTANRFRHFAIVPTDAPTCPFVPLSAHASTIRDRDACAVFGRPDPASQRLQLLVGQHDLHSTRPRHNRSIRSTRELRIQDTTVAIIKR
jgi:hypothetical protein